MHGYDLEVVVSAVVSDLVLLMLLWPRRSGRGGSKEVQKSLFKRALCRCLEESKGGVHAIWKVWVQAG